MKIIFATLYLATFALMRTSATQLELHKEIFIFIGLTALFYLIQDGSKSNTTKRRG